MDTVGLGGDQKGDVGQEAGSEDRYPLEVRQVAWDQVEPGTAAAQEPVNATAQAQQVAATQELLTTAAWQEQGLGTVAAWV